MAPRHGLSLSEPQLPYRKMEKLTVSLWRRHGCSVAGTDLQICKPRSVKVTGRSGRLSGPALRRPYASSRLCQETQPWSPLVTQPGALCTLVVIFYIYCLLILILDTAIGPEGFDNLPKVTQWAFESCALTREPTFFPFISIASGVCSRFYREVCLPRPPPHFIKRRLPERGEEAGRAGCCCPLVAARPPAGGAGGPPAPRSPGGSAEPPPPLRVPGRTQGLRGGERTGSAAEGPQSSNPPRPPGDCRSRRGSGVLLENLENGLRGPRPAASSPDCSAGDPGFAPSSQGENKVWVQSPQRSWVSVAGAAHQRRRAPCRLRAVIFGRRLI